LPSQTYNESFTGHAKIQSLSLPSLSVSTATPGLPGIRHALAATRHLLEMYRRQFSDDKTRRRLQWLDHRLLAITQQLQNIAALEKQGKIGRSIGKPTHAGSAGQDAAGAGSLL
jgi:hypothetical protein